MSTKYLKYTCINTEPLSITDLYNSKSDEAAILPYITGSSIRGAVMNTLASQNSNTFEKYKAAFFDGTLRFLNAYPALDESTDSPVRETLPVPKGFYESRKADNNIIHIFNDEDGSKLIGKKRAKTGKFAAFTSNDTKKLLYMSPSMGETFKIRLARNEMSAVNTDSPKKQQLFRGDYLEKGQIFHGYIAFSHESIQEQDIQEQDIDNQNIRELIQIVKNVLTVPDLRLGSNRSSGYGAVRITLEPNFITDRVPFAFLSIASQQNNRQTHINMLCLSNLCMLNEYGEPCGINEQELAELLKCRKLEVEKASSSVTHICNFNRITGGRSPEYPVYEAGSIFRLKCCTPPSVEALQEVESHGLGILIREGLGQVLFIQDLENISQKEKYEPAISVPEKEDFIPQKDLDRMARLCALSILQKRLERSITQYVLNHPFEKGSASKSQRGNINALCKSLRYKPEDSLTAFNSYFKHIEEKESTAKTHRVQVGSQMTLKNSVMMILEKDLFELLGQQADTICGLKTTDLITTEHQFLYKLQLIEELIRYANRKLPV